MPPAELSIATANFGTHNIMDFSRSQQGLNNVNNGNANDQSASFDDFANNMMMGPMDQSMLMRRMAANRAAGLQGMGQDNSTIGMSGPNPMMGGGSSMFGQAFAGSTNPNRGGSSNTNASQSSIVGQMGGSADARLAMIQQQADRDELLFQLLLARHRRQAEIQQDITSLQQQQQQQQQQDLGGNQQGFGLRNQGGNGGSNGSSSFFPDQDQSSQNQQQGGMLPGMFSGGMNLMGSGHPAFNPTMLHDPTNRTTNSLLFGMQQQQQQQQQQAQDPFLAGLSKDSQRIDPSSSNRFLSLQQQSGGGIGGFGGMMDFGNLSGNKRAFGDDMKPSTTGEMDKLLGFMGGEPPSKKKRFHKKKPADMPRRPLSAYNLFFSEERERILKEIDEKEDGGKAVMKNDSPETGADDNSKVENGGDTAAEESKKPRALLQPLLPSEKKRRPHRKTHGKIGFRMLAQMVGKRWKELPEEKRAYYQELAKEDTRRQKKAMEEYYLKHSDKLPQDAAGDDSQGGSREGGQEGNRGVDSNSSSFQS